MDKFSSTREDGPAFDKVDQPRHCEDCGHYHFKWQDCKSKNEPCGSYQCCIN